MQFTNVVTEERRQSVIDECTNIRERFGFNNQILNKIAKFYFLNSDIEIGSVEKTISYIVSILNACGLDEEGIKLYFSKHKNIYLTDYYGFRKKLSILNYCGLLEEGLNHDTLLSHEYSKNGLSSKLLYAVCANKRFNITIEEICGYTDLSLSRVKELLSKYKLDDRKLLILNHELRKTINQMNDYNNNTLKLK